MVNHENKYTHMQKDFYNSTAHIMNEQDHQFHNNNIDYWKILLKDVRNDSKKWCNKKALDFGCGTGRNIKNLLRMADWQIVDGIDLSKNNLVYAKSSLEAQGFKEDKDFKLHESSGTNTGDSKDWYDFIVSTIVLQHIAVHEIRFSILKGLFERLNKGGTLSIQMGYGNTPNTREYYDNFYEAKGTNSECDVRITDFDSQLKADLSAIGFKNIKHIISQSYSDRHEQWIYVTCTR